MPIEEQSENVVRVRVLFHGRVQGVGFRYTVRGIAKRFPIVGYVRNRSDGAVELEAEGTLESVRFFIEDIGEFFQGNIERLEESDIPAMFKEDGFVIRH